MSLKLTVRTRIRFNGQEYDSPDAMPADVRQTYERALASMHANHGGLTSMLSKAGAGSSQAKVSSQIVFNGQTYASADDMPADVRKLYEDILATVEANRNGIPDASAAGGQPAVQAPPDSGRVVPSLPASLMGAPKTESTTPRLIIVGVLIAIMLFALSVLRR
jgi:hypothetical protein